MAKKVSGKAPKKQRKSSDTGFMSDGDVQELLRRVARLERSIDELRGRLLYREVEPPLLESTIAALRAGQDRFIRSTTDGWLLVMMSGTKTALPSGLKVSLTSTSGGRDYGVVLEGLYAGKSFDVPSGNLDQKYRRVEAMVAAVAPRSGGPIIVDGYTYDLQVTITYTEKGTKKKSGPHAAMTEAANPVPAGTHDIEIADFPHELGSSYGAHGTVWFRIGHAGDRYVHPGQVSEGCITCVPPAWEEIFGIFHCARKGDGKSIGALDMPALIS
jgi:hypothetical protein